MALTLGKHSYACSPQLRGEMNDVIVGNYSSIAENCVFDCGFQHQYKNVTSFPLHRLDSSLPSNVISRGDIVIGNDVWIGEGAMIMSNVKIGDGCVIGARTVVTKDVDSFTVKASDKEWERFPSTYHRIALRKIAWWNWPDERVIKNAHLLLSEDIEKFINEHE